MIIVEGSFMVFSELFPNAFVSNEAIADQNVLVIPYQQGFLHLPKASLTEREMALIEFLSPSDKVVIDNPWLSFLQGDASLPITETNLQFIYLNHPSSLTRDLKQLLEDIFSNHLLVTELFPHQTLLVLDASASQNSSDIIKDLLPTIESDFGVSLKAFIGNAWIGFSDQELQFILSSEYAVFQEFHEAHAQQLVITFAQILLWAMAKKKETTMLNQTLRILVDKVLDGRELVAAMWQAHGNLVQTAQRLFIHRNSLQYRLDKFYQATGLNLKVLDDLALAYLIILQG
ncbi:helix-turn-helix domain-containing protein [Streptococcus pluranimalium]